MANDEELMAHNASLSTGNSRSYMHTRQLNLNSCGKNSSKDIARTRLDLRDFGSNNAKAISVRRVDSLRTSLQGETEQAGNATIVCRRRGAAATIYRAVRCSVTFAPELGASLNAGYNWPDWQHGGARAVETVDECPTLL